LLAGGLHFVLIVAVFNQGLFFRDQFVPILGLTLVLALAATLHRPARAKLLIVAVPLLVTTLVTSQIADEPILARPTIGGILIFGLLLVVAQSASQDRARRMLIDAALMTSAFAWVGVAFRITPYGRIAQNLWRGSSSITYSNAAAAVIAVGLLICLNRQRTRPSLFNGLQIVALLAGFASTQSRAGAIALVVGFLILGIGSRCKGCSNLVGPLLGGLIAGAAVVASSPITQDTRPLVAAAGLVAGVGIAIALDSYPLLRWPTVGAIAVVGVILLIGPASQVREDVGGVRFALTSEDRANEWEAASQLFKDNPWTGVGPGNAPLIWQQDGRTFEAEFAHNEYLQLAAEQGLLGLGALLLTAGLIAFFWVRRPDLDMIAAIVAVMLHAGFDFLAHIPVILIVFAIVLATPMNSRGPG
jgi:O-Antigen ligase